MNVRRYFDPAYPFWYSGGGQRGPFSVPSARPADPQGGRSMVAILRTEPGGRLVENETQDAVIKILGGGGIGAVVTATFAYLLKRRAMSQPYYAKDTDKPVKKDDHIPDATMCALKHWPLGRPIVNIADMRQSGDEDGEGTITAGLLNKVF